MISPQVWSALCGAPRRGSACGISDFSVVWQGKDKRETKTLAEDEIRTSKAKFVGRFDA